MSAGTSIQWATDTWNFLSGCEKVSRGCRLCYAGRLTATRLAHTAKYEGLAILDPRGIPRWSREVRFDDSAINLPLKWKRGKEEPRRIFVNSMSDTFHPEVELEVICQAFDVMAQTPWHQYLVLTKRPERMAVLSEYLERRYRGVLPNVAMGTSVEGVAEFAERIGSLQMTKAATRFLSIEPLLEPLGSIERAFGGLRGIDWVIVGGESGNRKLVVPFNIAWATDLREQCRGKCAFFYKQPGSITYYGEKPERPEDWTMEAIEEGRCLAELPAEFPGSFRYR
jgi:protein gp37